MSTPPACLPTAGDYNTLTTFRLVYESVDHSSMRRAESLNALQKSLVGFQLEVNQVRDKRQDQLFSPRQDSHKVVGAGGMEEWLNIPQLALKGLKLHPSADAHDLLDLQPAAKQIKAGNI